MPDRDKRYSFKHDRFKRDTFKHYNFMCDNSKSDRFKYDSFKCNSFSIAVQIQGSIFTASLGKRRELTQNSRNRWVDISKNLPS